MLPGIDPKKMNALMKQMGISQDDIEANRVIIETSDKNIIINNPSVVKIKMQGQTSFQISGEVSEESAEQETSEEDIKTIMEKTNCSEQEAKKALEISNGDLTEAILSLS